MKKQSREDSREVCAVAKQKFVVAKVAFEKKWENGRKPFNT